VQGFFSASQDDSSIACVGDLMSYGVQTVQANERVKDILSKIHRIGHEGYPVIENNQVIGLLTRRDADRAIEHRLDSITVKEIMEAGNITLRPSDTVEALIRLIVESGWGQIPIVNDDGILLGVVTRTDLIKHWAKTHKQTPHIAPESLHITLGLDTTHLIERITATAQAQSLSIYLVGGVVRDLLLKRPNLDVDFVVEGDAITFAESLSDAYGGEVNSFVPFGTAKWMLNQITADALGVLLENLPHHIDFATARNEFYMHPTALPTVYKGSIKLDLGRRDFTLNTLAVQVSPSGAYGRILDYYSGLNDLEAKLIRVLHSLSFVDDPTRILRAIRFSERLHFDIEKRTSELIQNALPMLGRITGERVRNELTLLFQEESPENGLKRLQDFGILIAIHPHFARLASYENTLYKRLGRINQPHPQWADDENALYWHVLLAHLLPQEVLEVGERLLIGQSTLTSLHQASYLVHHDIFARFATPSEIVSVLEGCSSIALLTAWLFAASGEVQKILEHFVTEWQHIKSTANGHTLQAMGIPPSSHYRRILTRLRQAWLDGFVKSESEERDLLETLVKELKRGDT